MDLRGDDRGQSIQIGAVLLFAILIVAFSSYQAFVVPQQNERVEVTHNEQVQGQLQDLRNTILDAQDGGRTGATTVTLGPRYPTRALALNPEPPAGALRTVGTTDSNVTLTVANATATGEAGDVWNGTARQFGTGLLAYEPGYNLYRNAPVTTYERTVLYDDFGPRELVVANQTMVDGRRLSLVTLNGSLDRTRSGTVTVDVDAASAGGTVPVQASAADEPITLTFQSRLGPDTWARLLSDESQVAAVSRSPDNGTASLHGVRVELATGTTYRLGLTKVGLGRGVTEEEPAYLDVAAGSAGSVTRGTDREVTFVVRDRFDNPVGNASVNLSVDGASAGTLSDTRVFTDDDGEATVTYRTDPGTSTGTQEIRATLADDAVLGGGSFQTDDPFNATASVTVSAGGTYDLRWEDPEATSGNDAAALSNCSSTACTWDVSQDSDNTLQLRALTDPSVDGLSLDYAVSDASVADVGSGSGSTGAGGTDTVDLNPASDGTTHVYALGNDAGARITITVQNAP